MSEKYSYNYSVPEKKEAEEIRKKYETKNNTESTLEQIKRLDKNATKCGSIISVITGIVGALILGVGMCCVTVWIENMFVTGIIIGIIGIAAVLLAYPIYKSVTGYRRKKIAPLILSMTDEILKK